MTPECAPPIQAADRAFNAQEVDSTAPAKERRLFPLRATDDCSRLLVEKGRATSGQTPVLEDLVGRLVNKHGKSGRPRDIVSQLRNLPTLEEQLDKGRFKAPLYSLGVMTDTPLNLNELFAELSRGNPPTCSMSMLIEALHARWPTVDPLPSATAGRGREHSSDCSSSRDASVSSASSAGRRRRRLGQQAGPALQEKAEARLAENVKDDAYSDDDFETEEAEPAQHLEEPSVILPAAKPASQAALRCPSTRDDGSDEHEADEDGYADGDFEDDEASRVEKDESDDDVLGESEDVLDESEHQDLLDQSEHQDDDDVLDESEHQDVPDQSGDEGAHRPARAALAAVPDEVGSEGSERDQERSDIESVASG
ncbi:unnamed protein product [Prorocentrum cordatum]|uniref:DNA-directed RNA polymerase III subunit RPC9 n=1 Tax=Prorocentrum cordatum TaxID=2364126 RepID=A0ABN9RHK5_9DINO|nr:unnamed protein product [Polarella glacialis]|mmetsp:Transcript_104802/g.296492  ORF Transcript_104802/g.296492 Transcript_104802/m.296492 type:complete len:368 (-) Transcript_104802:225-1328(-)